MNQGFHERLNQLLAAGDPFVAVTVVDVAGSVPQDRGAKMLVTAKGLDFGTVGGGRIETKAIGEARQMLELSDAAATRFVDWNLIKDVGMTCGGRMRLYFERHNHAAWPIVIFGAGHVANALTRLLVRLDCRITCYDTRREWLDRLPESPRLTPVLSHDLPGEVADLPDQASVLLMTMGHATDSPILAEILRARSFPYLGVIGSASKARRLRKDLEEAGIPAEARHAFHCPIGLPLGNNHPLEISISIAAQLLQVRDTALVRRKT